MTEEKTPNELRREWCRLIAEGRRQSEDLHAIGRGELDVSDEQLEEMVAAYRKAEHEWDKVDDLLLALDDGSTYEVEVTLG